MLNDITIEMARTRSPCCIKQTGLSPSTHTAGQNAHLRENANMLPTAQRHSNQAPNLTVIVLDRVTRRFTRWGDRQTGRKRVKPRAYTKK